MSYNTCVGFLPLVNNYQKFFAKEEHMEDILDILSIAFDEDLNAVVVKRTINLLSSLIMGKNLKLRSRNAPKTH